MPTLSQCLSAFKVRDLALPRELVSLRHPEQKLFEAVQVLADHHLLSAPVLDSEGKLIGMLDSLDVVAYVVNEAADGKTVLSDHDIESLAMWVGTVELDDPLDQVCDTVAGPVRRSVVLGDSGKPVSVITQSTLVQFLHSKKEEIEALKSCGPASDFCSRSVITVGEHASALEAFNIINQKQVSSLVIVDADGHVLTVISATDLVMGLAHWQNKSPALERLKACNVVDFALSNRKFELKDRTAAVAVAPSAPLQEVIEKLAVARVHRVVVMGDNRELVGVISLSDICKAISPVMI
eukprot:TRINITY_DN74313_c0_g1_i1.p1 TRINITY_DN74313_c0_g1~~TRINITY_DN74313_c0_g1_i1.p1  ORF type:complete len:295 (-),score=51.87 TRINITY_DN74313_c0_g1_i1:47-931(-)